MATNHNALYGIAKSNLATRSAGYFRVADICDNPPCQLGKRFAVDVKRGLYTDVKYVKTDRRSAIYEKL